MEVKNNLEELCTLINESNNQHQLFIDNLDLWKNFYNNRHIIIRQNILNPKLFTIIKFLLEQEKGEIFDYFHSNIIEEVKRNQDNVTYELEKLNTASSTNIDKLFTNLSFHGDLAKFLSNLQIEDIFGDIKKYSSKELELNTAISMTNILYQNFFSIEPEIVKRALEFITKTIISVQKSELKKDLMNTELIAQYINKVLPIKIFVGHEITDDELVKQIKTHQLKDPKIIVRLFNSSSMEIIYEIFDNDLSNIITFLNEADYVDEVKKQEIINKLFDKLLEEEYYSDFLELIVQNNQQKLFKRYLTDSKYIKIIIGCMNSSLTDLSSNAIKYLLSIKNLEIGDNNDQLNYDIARGNFIFQCSYLVTRGVNLSRIPEFNIDDIKNILYTRYRVNPTLTSPNQLTINKNDTIEEKEQKSKERYLKGLDIDFNTAIDLLKAYLFKQIKLSNITAQAIIRSIANYFLNILEIENNGIYFYEASKANGVFNKKMQTININHRLIRQLLNEKVSMYQRFKVFRTLLHEIKHSLINQKKKNNIWNMDSYEMEKEDCVSNYDYQFYSTNYKTYKEEIAARIGGANSMFKFIELYLPEYLDKIQDETINELEEERTLFSEQDASRTMKFFEDINVRFHLGFDTLVRYNPDILTRHQILNLEYYPNGFPKKYEDIWLERTEENKDLIDEILRTRYPESTGHNLNVAHAK